MMEFNNTRRAEFLGFEMEVTLGNNFKKVIYNTEAVSIFHFVRYDH